MSLKMLPTTASKLSRSAAVLLLASAVGWLAGCSEKAATPTLPTPAAPASPNTPVAASPPPAVAAPAPATPVVATRSLSLNVQGVASAGVTVRVKGIELGEDATVLKVSMSYASRIASSTTMALTDTFLEDEKGNRLMLKRPEDNRDLSIRDGDTMDGDLVFLGRVPPGAATLKLVFNESNQPDNVAGPGLVMLLAIPPRS
jgi:hypothetical protein